MSSLILSVNKKTQLNSAKSLFQIDYETSSKFHNDKVNFENDDFYILIDGVILNKASLLKESNATDWKDYLIESYKSEGNNFHKKLKGSYYGFLFDKKADRWIIFTDHISSKPIYYADDDEQIVLSNDYYYLVNYLKKQNKKITLNEQAAHLILTFGNVFEDITIASEIKRLLIGYNVVLENGEIQFNKYYELKNEPIDISENEAIEEIDIRFREAVSLAFEKDREYGYKHIAALSGGLDSRMTVCVAHDLGYKDQLNLTFSKSNYIDETVPKKITSDLKHDWLFKSLDNGSFLMDIDDSTKVTGGNVIYSGIAHGMSLFKYINFDNLGILHSGQLAFAISGLHFSSSDPKFKDRISSVLNQNNINLKGEYKNIEILSAYIKGFYNVNQGNHGIQKCTETYSPFYDIDFMNFTLSIPNEIRYDHNIYKKWILKKYPKAASYIWEKEKVALDYKYRISIRGKKIPLNQLPLKILSKIGIKRYGVDTKNHMNPMEYWYQTNSDLRNYIESYYKDNISFLSPNSEIKKICVDMFNNGRETNKINVLTLLSAVKYINSQQQV